MTLKEFLAKNRESLSYQCDIYPPDWETLLQIVEMQDAALRSAESRLDGIKYSLESRVYTLDEDEFCKVFEVRDDITLARATIDEALLSGTKEQERG